MVHLSASGVFRSFSSVGYIESRKHTVNALYSYGRQTVPVPAANVTIAKGTLDLANGYLEGPEEAHAIALGCAGSVSEETGGKPTVAALRTLVRTAAAEMNKVYGGPVLKTADITGGVRISTTNPWTHKTAAYTAKIVGNKGVAGRA